MIYIPFYCTLLYKYMYIYFKFEEKVEITVNLDGLWDLGHSFYFVL